MLSALVPLFADDPPKGGGMDTMVLMFLPLVLFVFFIVLPMRRDARTRRELLSTLKKGDRVLIQGFLVATVLQLDKAKTPQGEDELLVKIDENANIKMRVLRSSVTRIFASAEPTKDTKEGS